MSKKTELEYKEYYSYVADTVTKYSSFEIPKAKSSFQNIIQILISKKYISLTKDGFSNLLPNGIFLRNAILEFVGLEMQKNDYLEYRFTSLFSVDRHDPKVKLINKFTNDMYKVNNKYFLKYASDPVIFDYFKNKKLNNKIKIYSPDYYYRVSTNSELKHLINPREFIMTDFHVFSDNKFSEYINASIMNKKILNSFVDNKELYLNIDTNKIFYESNKDKITKMLKALKLNAIINVTSIKTHYYSIQNQYITNYYYGNKTQFANLQYDEVNGERFNIKSAKSGNFLTIIHGTPIGRVEKIFAYIYGKAIELSEINKTKPVIPNWLSPIICTLIPISKDEKIIRYCDKLSKILIKNKIRNNIDQRDLPFRTKIKDAEQQWIPYIIMLGDHELNNKNISVRDRLDNSTKINNLTKLIKIITKSIKNYPNMPQSTKRIVTKCVEY